MANISYAIFPNIYNTGFYCCAIGVEHTSAKSGSGLVTLFDSYYDDGVNVAIGVQHTSARSGGGLVTLFDSYYNDGANAAIGVQHTSANLVVA